MDKVIIHTAEELIHPLFYGANEKLELDAFCFQRNSLQPYFKYEAAYYAGFPAEKPWVQQEIFIPLVIKEWKALHVHLRSIYVKRQREEAVEPMKQAIALCIQFLFWLNNQPVKFIQAKIEASLAISPVNVMERLAFIMKRPSLYQSFIQLGEVMIEMEKLYAKEYILRQLRK
ncbi:YpoC family protein [Cytobacillus purgationiresistens]|uniref:YpoC-like domain-containing protein n=1 Tax=Cytobacillus purgationiresistens TaxID=863449 RepID=A0ABU0AIF9_9BACI|nr:hypothetical protein [Cytobacillus purgationiresistens]MDQ0271043.1 hypothetical protein [Cytobacillus purgationiresistens]